MLLCASVSFPRYFQMSSPERHLIRTLLHPIYYVIHSVHWKNIFQKTKTHITKGSWNLKLEVSLTQPYTSNHKLKSPIEHKHSPRILQPVARVFKAAFLVSPSRSAVKLATTCKDFNWPPICQQEGEKRIQQPLKMIRSITQKFTSAS